MLRPLQVEFEMELLKEKRETLTQILLDLMQKKKERAENLQVNPTISSLNKILYSVIHNFLVPNPIKHICTMYKYILTVSSAVCNTNIWISKLALILFHWKGWIINSVED